jgi:hypothetical protein
METYITAINAVGFPIVAFLLMFYQSTKTIKENTKVLRELCDKISKK